MIIRPVATADLAAVADIYAHYVLHSTVSFEETPPGAEVMGERHAAVTGRGLPYLCAEIEGAVIGFAYAGPYGTRPAYRYTVEDSVYIAPQFHGRGVGKALLAEVIARCEALGLRQMLAVIGDSGNAGSIALHAALGFSQAGMGKSVGWKQGRWVDIVWMQRPLNDGAASPPEADGIRR
jgi:L-amino acid N-acyltransferase YncA